MSRAGRSGGSGGGFWSSLFGGGQERERFSAEELRHLHGVLLRNQIVNDSNRETVVEALRSIAELVIWGDQHDPSMVEYFLTENLLAHFNQILQQRSNRRGDVATQVLQTLSILIQNLRNQQTIYYLFSNNHINEIVSMRFDFDDDEVLGYYVNLLKTISLRLNEATVQFFFQQLPGAEGGASFPLYTEAVKFVNHRDGMVRTAVKTLTLNVYAIRLPAVQRFVTQRPASNYLEELGAYVAEQCQVLDRLLSSWDVTSPQAPAALEGCLAEIEDLLSYCNDILTTGVPVLRELLLECLWRCFVGPVLFWPLIQEDVAAQHIAALTLGAPGGGPVAGGGPAALLLRPGTSALAGLPQAVERGIVGPLCSLFVFERLLHAVTDRPLLATVLGALLGGPAAGGPSPHSPSGSRPGTPAGCSPGQPAAAGHGGGSSGGSSSQQSLGALHSPVVAAAAVVEAGNEDGGAYPAYPAAASSSSLAPGCFPLPPALLARLQYSPLAYRAAFLGALRGSDSQLASAAVRVLAALVYNRAVEEPLLEMLGLLPRRRKKQRQLLAALTTTPSTCSLASSAGAAPVDHAQQPAPTVIAAAAAAAEPGGPSACTQQQPACQPSTDAGAVAHECNLPQQLGDSTEAGQGGRGGADGGSGGNIETTEPQTPLPGAADSLGRAEGASPPSTGGSDGGSSDASRRAPAGDVLPPPSNSGGSLQQPALPAQPPPLPPQPQPPPVLPARGPEHLRSAHPAGAARQATPPGMEVEDLSEAAGWVGAAYGEAQFEEVSGALLGLLGRDLLPPLALLTLSWLLNQLLSVGASGAELSPGQAAALAGAVRQAQLAAQTQLEGSWGDVLWPLIEREWGRSRQTVLRGGAGGVHVSVQTWMQGILVQELRWQLAGGKAEEVLSESAAGAAKLAVLTAQALVVLTQTRQVLLGGEVPPRPPLAAAPAGAPAPEIAERSTVLLGQWLSCMVAFARGQERKTYFAVEGLPAGYYLKSCSASGRGGAEGRPVAPAPAGATSESAGAQQQQGQQVDPEALAASLAASSPVVVLAEPGPRPNTGVVLSVAPLLGAFPRVDEQHPKWLHVHVRPPTRLLLRALGAAPAGLALLALEQQLVPGHWVLAFGDADKAAAARELVESSARGVRDLQRQLLLPILGPARLGARWPGLEAS